MATRGVNVRIGAEEQVSRESSKAAKAIRGLDKESTKSSKNIMQGWAAATIVVTGVMRAWGRVSAAVAQAGQAYQTQIQAEQKLSLAVRATGSELGLTTEALIEHAQALSRVTQFGDEVIISAQGVLAQFGTISGETMPRATRAALDLASALGTDLNSAAQRLGRALSEPERATTLLRQANIILNDSQQETIDNFLAVGDEASAMGFILEQVERQFGGFAEAVGQSSVGILARFENLKGDLLEAVGGIMTPLRTRFVESITPAIEDLIQWINENGPAIYAWLTNIPDIALIVFRQIGQILQRTFQWDTLRAVISSLLDGLLGAFRIGLGMIFDLWKNLFVTIEDAAVKMGQDWPKHLINGITQGLTSGGPVGQWLIKNLFGVEWEGLRLFDTDGDLRSHLGDAFRDTSAGYAETLKTALADHAGNIRTTWAAVATNYTDITTAGAREIAAVIEEGKAEFSAFQARETATPTGEEPLQGTFDFQPFSSDLIGGIGAAFDASAARIIADLEEQWKKERQEAIDNALHLSVIAQYGREYVRLQEEREAVAEALNVLVEEGFHTQAAILENRLSELNTAIEDIETGAAGEVEAEAHTLIDAFGGMESIVAMVSDGMGGFAGQLFSAVAAFGPLGLAVVALQTVFDGLMRFLGPIINRILQPLFNVLGAIGEIIGRLLVPVFNALSPIIMMLAQIIMTNLLPIFSLLEIVLLPVTMVLQLLSPLLTAFAVVLEVVMSPIRFLADLFSWVVEKIRFSVIQLAAWLNHPFSASNRASYIANQGVSDPGKFTSDAFSGLQGRIREILSLTAAAPTAEVVSLSDMLGDFTGITEWSGPGADPGVTGAGVHGGSVTVQHPPDIFIHVHIGEGGVAFMGDRELRQVGDVVVRSIEEVLGAGGEVSWLEAGA